MNKKILILLTTLAIVFNIAYAKEAKRSVTVFKNAVWVEADNEWELGKRNKDGDMVGEWKWWLAPEGHLVCHTFFTKTQSEGKMTYTRYHQDGTVSRKGSYLDGEPHGITISIKSENPTTENFNPRVDCWKAVTTFKYGYVVEEHYFNKQGKEIHKPYIAK